MNIKHALLVLSITLLLIQDALSQNARYINELFTEVTVTPNVSYGVNSTVFNMWENGGFIESENLLLNIYEPVGDTLEDERPLVLVFHSGNFLPPGLNWDIIGTRYDSSCVEICTQLARRGFTAASVDYRLGWNPLAGNQSEAAAGLIQAIYRGVQDGRTAIRFFRKTYADGNPYHIDPDKIIAWGNGSGGFISLGMTGLSEYNKIVETTHGPGKFLIDIDGDGLPDFPMVVEAIHGDIEGKMETIVPDPNNFGLMPGDTSNHANHVAFSSDFDLCVAIGGAIPDLGWLEDITTPIIAIQSPYDMFLPYDDHVLGFHLNSILRVQGSKLIGEWMESTGTNQLWKDHEFNDMVTLEAITNSSDYGGHPFYEGVYPFYAPPNSNGNYEGVVIDWWNPSAPAAGLIGCDSLTWEECPHPNDQSGNLSYHEYGLQINEEMSAEKARANIAKVMDFFIPRACVALDLACNGVTNTEEPLLNEKMVTLMPNPAQGQVLVETVGNQTINQIELYSFDGRLVSANDEVNNTQTIVDFNSQAPGMYLIKIHLDAGVVVKKLAVK